MDDVIAFAIYGFFSFGTLVTIFFIALMILNETQKGPHNK